jgi:hypothetical protein
MLTILLIELHDNYFDTGGVLACVSIFLQGRFNFASCNLMENKISLLTEHMFCYTIVNTILSLTVEREKPLG